ncbi:crotonase/enoyl-CoA hydratase family protein [Ketobacter sp.]|uniref:crotonase/enoyl-CoA hydratase family protein n=1 Tax=Ketobacter sp. TaxID=2083498 RepID=UPI000F122F77|nr:crotonase/enoyl-CoA hydratase family protein [Ketobacter sp.]RLU00305.1 MAG: crotonase/enoyl-CoA hydratase family protein [Ketobacter sp.]
MEYRALTVTIEQKIAHIVLNRPAELNTMNVDFWRELPHAVRQIDEQASARVIVISSTGKHFTAGMDLGVFMNPKNISVHGDPGRSAENLRRLVLQLQDAFNVLETVRIPVLAAVQGGCIGGGLDMISAADCRYCTEDAFFCIKETDLGMTADVGTLQRLPHLIPQGMIRELAYTGAKLPAQRALDIGLVNAVYPDQESMLSAVQQIALEISKRSPLAITGCKQMINYTRDHSVQDSLSYMATWQSGMFRPEDMMKAFSAKAQQMEPDFEDLHPIKPPFAAE